MVSPRHHGYSHETRHILNYETMQCTRIAAISQHITAITYRSNAHVSQIFQNVCIN